MAGFRFALGDRDAFVTDTIAVVPIMLRHAWISETVSESRRGESVAEECLTLQSIARIFSIEQRGLN